MINTADSVKNSTEIVKPANWFKRHQVTTFFIITYVITWVILMVAILFPEQFKRIFGEVNLWNPVAPFVIGAPTISATILTAVWQGKSGLRELYSRLIRWRFGLQWYALILLGIPFLGWLAAQAGGAKPVYELTNPALAILILLNLLYTGPLCEELGWRGYALPRLLRQFNPLVASLILGIFWGVWHLPSFYISSLVQSSLSLPAFLFFGLFTSILMTWIFQHTGGSVLAAVLFHYTINVSFSIIGAPLVTFGLLLMALTVLVLALDKGMGWFRKPEKTSDTV
jgi:membrane protease YdiL (CAAX protease family)